jgi:diguanylate cyclase (GGDEF)-like protein/PAS domain S-box-containing protein
VPRLLASVAPARSRRGLLATAVVPFVVGSCWLAGRDGRSVLPQVADLALVAAAVLAALASARTDQRTRDDHRAWWWLQVAAWAWAAAALVPVLGRLVGRATDSPVLGPLGHLAVAVPMAVGLTRFPRSGDRLVSSWRTGLDCLLVADSLLLTSTVWLLDPVLDQRGDGLAAAAAMTVPLLDALLVALSVARCLVVPVTRASVWAPLTACLVLLTVTDSVHTATGSAPVPAYVGWYAALGLLALAARNRGRPRTGAAGTTVPGVVRQLLPALAVGVAAASCLAAPEWAMRHRWLALSVIVLLVAREAVVAMDHSSLTSGLSDAVDRRTSQLKRREQWWEDVVANLSDVVIVVDRDGVLDYCSPSVSTALGHWPRLDRATQLRDEVHPDDAAAVAKSITPVLLGQEREGFVECRVRRDDGSYGWFEVRAAGQLSARELDGAVLTLHDVSERRELTSRLMHQAHHDALTGLPNRTRLMTEIDRALRRGDRGSFGLLMLDLDDFKVINDRHGHAAGDLVLREVAVRLAAQIRSGDVVARLGGDEFAFLVHGDAAQVRLVANRLVEQVGQPVLAGGRQFTVRGSVGIVVADDRPEESAQSLLSHADIALYEAKARDKGGVVLIQGPERLHAAQQVELKEQVAQPDLDQFSVVYQPIVDLGTGALRGVEALLRWHHPDLGLVPPDVFIPMAEHGGSIQALGWHVLETACLQLASWRRAFPDRRLAVGVNASVRQLDEPGFAGRLLAMAATYGIDADQLVLELTEQALAVDFETAVGVVAELRAGGLSVAVDDYGTGYSSLRYLDRFDADVVKIDRSFVWNLAESVHTQKIVRSVMHMAESLDLQSIAEGIETAEQLAVVRSLGCELGQGYLFSRPVPPEEIGRMLVEGTVWPVDADAADAADAADIDDIDDLDVLEAAG